MPTAISFVRVYTNLPTVCARCGRDCAACVVELSNGQLYGDDCAVILTGHSRWRTFGNSAGAHAKPTTSNPAVNLTPRPVKPRTMIAKYGGKCSCGARFAAGSEIVYREVFDREALFPVLFGGMALVMGAATLVNGHIVERIGLVRMLRIDLVGYLVSATALLIVTLVTAGRPSLLAYLVVLGLLLSSHAMIIPNMSARAMEPMGDIAGVASAVIGATLIGGGALIGAAIDRAYDGTVRPLASALVVGGLLVAVLLAWSSRTTTVAVGPPR